MSNAMQAVEDEIKETGGADLVGYGLCAALEAMTPHWRSQIESGESPSIMAEDLGELELRVRRVREELISARKI